MSIDEKASPTLHKVLQASRVADSFSTPLSFLVAAANQRATAPRASSGIFEGLDRFVSAYPAEVLARTSNAEDDEAFLLNDALLDARSIREQTGGRDDFIGLRHVLFSVLVPEKPTAFRSTHEAVAKGGTDPSKLTETIAEFCKRSEEKGENVAVWQKIIEQRLDRVQEMQSKILIEDFVVPFRPDDPLSRGQIDRSGAELEVESFATMICWHDFQPPLAVGVFGDWGSGKSFFMRRVHDRINEISGAAAKQNAAKQNFLQHIVQIRFNAWHYAETNLWASLVEHILTKLDEWAAQHNRKEECDTLLGKLSAAREWSLQSAKLLVERKKEYSTASVLLDAAEKNLTDTQKELEEKPEVWAQGAWNTVLEDPKVNKAVSEAAADLGVTEEVKESASDLRDAVERFQLRKGSPAVLSWHRFLARHPVTAIVLFLMTIGLPPLIIWGVHKLGLPTDGAGVAGVVGAVSIGAIWITKVLNKAHTTLNSVHQSVKEQIATKTAAQADEASRLQASVDEAKAAAEAASLAMKTAAERLSNLKSEFSLENQKEQLLNFVRRRAASEDYRSELGFIAQVRRDFDELNRLMYPLGSPEDKEGEEKFQKELIDFIHSQEAEHLDVDDLDILKRSAEKPKDSERMVFERIVLYIDDLDRCPAEQVVLVLQAIHLLLAYPLFVVFVAVDVRWLKNALECTYPQFGEEEQRELADPSDYLEKIFQIPYWVRPMSPDGTAAFMGDVLGPRLTEPTGSSGHGTQDADRDRLRDGGVTHPDESVDPNDGQYAPVRLTQPLEISEDERAFMEELARVLDGSPRRVLRFINSYRLIKATLTVDDQTRLADDGFKELLTLLAIQITLPEAFSHVAREAGTVASQGTEPLEPGETCVALKRLLACGNFALNDLERWLSLVARYGFTAN